MVFFSVVVIFPYSNVAKNPFIHAISIQELKGVSVKREPGTCWTLRMANGIVWNLIANRKVGMDKIFIKKKNYLMQNNGRHPLARNFKFAL